MAVYEQDRKQAPDNWPLPLTPGLGKVQQHWKDIWTARQKHVQEEAHLLGYSRISFAIAGSYSFCTGLLHSHFKTCFSCQQSHSSQTTKREENNY